MDKNQLKKKQDDLEALRLDVVALELKARYWKAEFEVRHYSLKNAALEDRYNKFVEKKMEEEKQKMDQYMEQLQKNKDQGVKIEPINL